MEGAEVKVWRRAERERLIALRQGLPAAQRHNWSAQIDAALRGILAKRPGILGVYWPFRAEFDPRPLPVVIDKKCPLEYRAWRPGDKLVDGVWNIPIPEKRDIVTPALVLAPLVGFDEACYRLGYGGGYFDRTLAVLSPRVFAIGVGFEVQRIATIYPQSFDIAMDLIVTETGIRERSAGTARSIAG